MGQEKEENTPKKGKMMKQALGADCAICRHRDRHCLLRQLRVRAPNFHTLVDLDNPLARTFTWNFTLYSRRLGWPLLVALIIIYARTYLQTKLISFWGCWLFCLPFSSNPFIPIHFCWSSEVAPGFAIAFFSPVADVFTIIAYTVFLYLSLE